MQRILHGFSELAHNLSLNALDQHQNELFLICERWYLCLKIIRQLVISGHQSDTKSMQVLHLVFFLTMFICLLFSFLVGQLFCFTFQEVRQVKEVSPMLLSAIRSLIPYCKVFVLLFKHDISLQQFLHLMQHATCTKNTTFPFISGF